MAIVRLENAAGYSKVRNSLWTDKRLSTHARFLLGFMLSLPDDWKFHQTWIAEQIGWNRSTVSKYITELMANGYITRERERHADGTFGDELYAIYEVPELNTQQLTDECVRPDIPAPTHAEDTDNGTTSTTKKHSLNKTEKDIVVVAFPSDLKELLSKYNLNPNAATIKRWLSLATVETIEQVIQYATQQTGVKSVLGYITGILMQGFVKAQAGKQRERRRHTAVQPQAKRRDIMPEWIVRQMEEARCKGEGSNSTDDYLAFILR
jgi:hypothetical protein